jgi:UDP-glucose 4-epimerase
MTQRSIVITGCAGLLGSHLSRHLIQRGYKVIGIDNLSGGYSDYLPNLGHEQFEFWPVDLSDPWGETTLEHIFCNPTTPPIAACFHFAAYAAEGLSPFIRRFNYKNNVLASAAVINACINYGVKLIFTSSMAVYGNQTPPFNESMTPQPIDPYGVAKYAVEMDIKIAASQHNLEYTIVRPHNIVGIYQNIWDKYRNVAGIFIRKVLDGEPMLIYGDGYQTRAFSDVKYYMEPFEKMIDTCGIDSNRTVNIGADKVYTINELADTVQRVAWKNGYEAEKEHVAGRHEVKHAHCDHSIAKSIFGFRDDTNLEELIDEMFKWAQKEPKRPQKKMRYEVEKGIYDYWK